MERNWRLSMPTPPVYWASKALYDLHHKPDDLARFKRDPEAYLDDYAMGDALRSVILGADVAGLYLAGVNPYLLRAHCIGMGIPEAVSVPALQALRGREDV